MNSRTVSTAKTQSQSRMFIELALVIGLPVFAIFIASALGIVAYTAGFTPIPESPAAIAAHR
jgi:hypothetical protein